MDRYLRRLYRNYLSSGATEDLRHYLFAAHRTGLFRQPTRQEIVRILDSQIPREESYIFRIEPRPIDGIGINKSGIEHPDEDIWDGGSFDWAYALNHALPGEKFLTNFYRRVDYPGYIPDPEGFDWSYYDVITFWIPTEVHAANNVLYAGPEDDFKAVLRSYQQNPLSYRRNSDVNIRQLERAWNTSGDRSDWLQLQLALRRAGKPYERTFIDDQIYEEPEDEEGFEHGETWIKTKLNNGWGVETWWDQNNNDEGDLIGWTTVSYRDPEDQIGMAVHCGDNDDCADRCHQRKVDSIINGSIEEYYEADYGQPGIFFKDYKPDLYPLENAAPELHLRDNPLKKKLKKKMKKCSGCKEKKYIYKNKYCYLCFRERQCRWLYDIDRWAVDTLQKPQCENLMSEMGFCEMHWKTIQLLERRRKRTDKHIKFDKIGSWLR
jgi:hypothetical protein